MMRGGGVRKDGEAVVGNQCVGSCGGDGKEWYWGEGEERRKLTEATPR